MEDPDVTEPNFTMVQAAANRMCASVAARPAELLAVPLTLPAVALVKQCVEMGCPGSGGLRLAELLMNLAPRMLWEAGQPPDAGAAPAHTSIGVQCVHHLVQIEVCRPPAPAVSQGVTRRAVRAVRVVRAVRAVGAVG